MPLAACAVLQGQSRTGRQHRRGGAQLKNRAINAAGSASARPSHSQHVLQNKKSCQHRYRAKRCLWCARGCGADAFTGGTTAGGGSGCQHSVLHAACTWYSSSMAVNTRGPCGHMCMYYHILSFRVPAALHSSRTCCGTSGTCVAGCGSV